MNPNERSEITASSFAVNATFPIPFQLKPDKWAGLGFRLANMKCGSNQFKTLVINIKTLNLRDAATTKVQYYPEPVILKIDW